MAQTKGRAGAGGRGRSVDQEDSNSEYNPSLGSEENDVPVMDSTAEKLHLLQRRIIAEKLGVPVEEVTPEFIDRYFAEKVYPVVRFTVCSDYGGYTNAHLTVLNRDEIREIETRAQKLKEILKGP
jgi:hypothetical protein